MKLCCSVLLWLTIKRVKIARNAVKDGLDAKMDAKRDAKSSFCCSDSSMEVLKTFDRGFGWIFKYINRGSKCG